MEALTRWNPSQELNSWHRGIDDLFARFLDSSPVVGERGMGFLAGTWLPSMEAYEKDGRYFVRLDLPGIDPKEVEVSADNHFLTIKGERKRMEEENREGNRYSETAYGAFERRIPLPKGVEADKISARYDNGVLEVSMPLPAHLLERKVPVLIEERKSDEAKVA